MRLLRSGIHFYLIGVLILTFGIALSILSTLGASPYDALSVGLFRTFGLTIGSWEVIVGMFLICLNAITAKEKPEFFALITSIITGIGIDFWYFCLNYIFSFNSLLSQTTSLILGIVITSFGIAIYLQSTIAPNPMDRSMLVISQLTRLNLTYSRLLISVILVTLALFFGGAVGIGTIINALISGWLIHLFYPFATHLKRTDRLNKIAT